MKRKDLTRKWLNSVGISLDTEVWIEDHFVSGRVSKKSKRGVVILKPIPQKGKYDLEHYYYCFTYKKVRYKISCARVIYALKFGTCPANKVVTHDDNGDLVLMTQKELYHKKVWERR
ncbi:MAG: hypothetical protein J6T10_19690 [Methanobrevibacter sp.]|nr:hypothetical protein [Methanobrevibacter sp.]